MKKNILLFEETTQIEVNPNQVVIEKQTLKTLLESHLGLTITPTGLVPSRVYAEKVSSIVADYRRSSHNMNETNLSERERIDKMQSEIAIVDMYFDSFVEYEETKINPVASAIIDKM